MTDEINTDDTLQTEFEDGQQAGTSSETVDDNGAGLAPVTGENQTKNEEGDQLTDAQRQEKIQQAINRQHRKYREEERKRVQAEQENQQLKERLQKLEAEQGEVEIPAMPDPFDEDYERKVQARDEAIRLKAAKDTERQRIIEQQQANEQAAKDNELQRFNDKVAAYDKRIIALGLDSATMQQAAQTVAEYGVSQDVVEFVLEHENGPLITQYLAAHPLELDELRSLPPMQAALKLHNVIAPAAASLKPSTSETPPPPETVGGRGATGDQVSPFIRGASFE